MKKQILTLAGVLSLLFVAGSAHAQLIQMKGNIPIEFTVLNKTLPAAEYRVVPNGTLNSQAMRIEDSDGVTVALVMVHNDDTGHSAKSTAFVFNRYGEHYYLSSMKVAGETGSWEFPKGKTEVEEARASQASEVLVASER